MARRSSKAQEAPVEKYPERPLEDALVDDAGFAAVENRQPDQIADYHEKHPTLKPGPAHKADVPTEEPGDAPSD